MNTTDKSHQKPTSSTVLLNVQSRKIDKFCNLVNVHFFPSPTAIPLHFFVVNTKTGTEHPWSSWQLVTALGSQRVWQASLFKLPSPSQWWSKHHLAHTSSNKMLGSQAQPFLLSPLPQSQLLMDLPAQPRVRIFHTWWTTTEIKLSILYGRRTRLILHFLPDKMGCFDKSFWHLNCIFLKKQRSLSLVKTGPKKTPNSFLRHSPEATICKTGTFLHVDKAISSWLFQKNFHLF